METNLKTPKSINVKRNWNKNVLLLSNEMKKWSLNKTPIWDEKKSKNYTEKYINLKKSYVDINNIMISNKRQT